MNLGFADADVFCNQIEQAFHKGLKINEPTYLKKYSIEREALNLIMLKSMDLFVNIFKNDNAPSLDFFSNPFILISSVGLFALAIFPIIIKKLKKAD